MDTRGCPRARAWRARRGTSATSADLNAEDKDGCGWWRGSCDPDSLRPERPRGPAAGRSWCAAVPPGRPALLELRPPVGNVSFCSPLRLWRSALSRRRLATRDPKKPSKATLCSHKQTKGPSVGLSFQSPPDWRCCPLPRLLRKVSRLMEVESIPRNLGDTS